MSKIREEPLPAEHVNKLFDRMWPDLKVVVDACQMSRPVDAPRRDQRDMIEELIERTRRIERNSGPAARMGRPAVASGGTRIGLLSLRLGMEARRLPPYEREQYVEDGLAPFGIAMADVSAAASAELEDARSRGLTVDDLLREDS